MAAHVACMQGKSETKRIMLMALGWALLAITPILGPLPGPGGIFTFAGGMILLLRNSAWAKRRYVLLKRRWPRFGDWADRAMRRPSALRRRAIDLARRPA